MNHEGVVPHFGGGFGIGHRHLGSFGIGFMLLILQSIVGFVLWIVCMVKAALGVRFMLPIAGEIAQNLAGESELVNADSDLSGRAIRTGVGS